MWDIFEEEQRMPQQAAILSTGFDKSKTWWIAAAHRRGVCSAQHIVLQFQFIKRLLFYWQNLSFYCSLPAVSLWLFKAFRDFLKQLCSLATNVCSLYSFILLLLFICIGRLIRQVIRMHANNACRKKVKWMYAWVLYLVKDYTAPLILWYLQLDGLVSSKTTMLLLVTFYFHWVKYINSFSVGIFFFFPEFCMFKLSRNFLFFFSLLKTFVDGLLLPQIHLILKTKLPFWPQRMLAGWQLPITWLIKNVTIVVPVKSCFSVQLCHWM